MTDEIRSDGAKTAPIQTLSCRTNSSGLFHPPPGSTVRILDVGSGPLTYLGKRWPEREVQIVAVDPLAEEYKALLAKHSIQPLVTPLAVHGENLLDAFQPNSFDLAYARNSLDHSYDPIKVICNMLCLVKPLHYVCLWHVVNEGIRQSYNGLHQWNFNIRRGDFIIGDGRRTRSVTAELAAKAEVSCDFQATSECTWVVAKLRKLPAS